MSWIYKRPNSPNWYYGWRDDRGKPRGHVIEPKTTKRIEAEVGQDLEDRKRRSAQTGELIPGVSWRHFKAEFLPEYRGKTLAIYNNSFRLFEKLSSIQSISDFTYNQAKDFKVALRAYVSPSTHRPLKDNSINITIRNMKTAWGEAVKLKYAPRNVFNEVPQVSVTKRMPRYLTKEQVRHLIKTAKASEHPDIYAMVLIVYYAGIRKQELINLKWTAFNFEQQEMYLHGSEGWEPKERREHTIGLHPLVARELKRRTVREGYVFKGPAGGKRSESATGNLLNRLYRKAGITETGWHLGRHSFSTHFQGRPQVLQKILDHKDLRTTLRYSHVTQEERQAVKDLKY